MFFGDADLDLTGVLKSTLVSAACGLPRVDALIKGLEFSLPEIRIPFNSMVGSFCIFFGVALTEFSLLTSTTSIGSIFLLLRASRALDFRSKLLLLQFTFPLDMGIGSFVVHELAKHLSLPVLTISDTLTSLQQKWIPINHNEKSALFPLRTQNSTSF